MSEFLDRTRARATGLVIDGEAGIGKTSALWTQALRGAAEWDFGDYERAAQTAEDAVQRAQQIGGRLPLSAALKCRAVVAAHRGRVGETRRAARDAIDSARENDMQFFTISPTTSRGLPGGIAGQLRGRSGLLSPKTVEMNLSRAWRELGIRSRAQTPGKTLVRRAASPASVGPVSNPHQSGQRFLVEWYDPALTAAPLRLTAAQLETNAAAVSAEGATVRLELILAALGDDVLYAVFGAASADTVLRVCQRTGCPPDRITADIRTYLCSPGSDVVDSNQSLPPTDDIAVSGVEV